MDYLFLKYAHIIAFVYWLGGDLGTFLASNYVVNRDIGTESRGVALKIMLACDQGPKLAMPLIVTLGLQMAYMTGLLAVPAGVMIAAWLVSIYWFSVVMILHLNEGKAFTSIVSKIDFYFRIAVVVILLLWAIAGLMDNSLIRADWVAYKMIVFAGLVTCGIFIRINLKPFIPAFVSLMKDGASDELNDTLMASLMRCRPYVWCIWGGLFLNAAIGVHLLG